jgi:choline dehydrogenase-like flavoprotein
MSASLAYRKNEAAILRGDVPEKYLRLLPHITGDRIVEIGSAEAVLACLLAKAGKDVVALERSAGRIAAGLDLVKTWMEREPFDAPSLQLGDIRDNLDIFEGRDTFVAVRVIYYLGDGLDAVFSAAAKHVNTVVLCGNKNRASWWREGRPNQHDRANNYFASQEGMRDVLMRHGFDIVTEVTEGDPIVVGKRA